MTEHTDNSLATLAEDGSVPGDRMADPIQAKLLVQHLIEADSDRSRKRALTRGIVDGNPPYKQGNLRKGNRSKTCNVNWRMAESYAGAGTGLFYDLFCEATHYATVELELTNDVDRKSRVATEEFDRSQRDEKSFDYNVQLSQWDMVLYGSGPFVFEDAKDFRCRAFETKNLKVPDHAPSDSNQWELAVLLVDYLPDQLYKFIRNKSAASDTGWDVEATKQAIINAYPRPDNGSQYLDWEWHQEQLKTGSFYYSSVSKVIPVAHIYYKEFPVEGEVDGRISHKIVLRENAANQANNSKTQEKFLFDHKRRFKNWSEVIHPMYYDHGNGGKHHSVTGMGVKMYSAMEYQNRLMCKLADDAFMPKVLFKQTTASASQQMNFVDLYEGSVLPIGLDLIQTAINPLIQDGLLMNNEISKTVSSNLSSYRQNLQDKPGNPITATETNFKASEQAKLGKTQLNRYYEQLDSLFAEKFRRICNPNILSSESGGREALDFQERCKARGVTLADLAKVRSVRATRVVGQGSAYVRQQSLEFLLGLISMLPEDGRANLIQDVIAARSGQFSVERYYPLATALTLPSEQEAEAMQWVAAMKVGVPPVITGTQNAVIYAQTFLQAASQAIQSLQQGGNPAEVVAFIDIAGAAIHAHLQRIKADPTRKQVYDALFQQWQKLAQLSDQLKAKLQADAEAQQEQQGQMQRAQAMQNGSDPEMQIQRAKAENDLKWRSAKNMQALTLKDRASAQKISIASAIAASKLDAASRNSEKE